MPTRQQVRKLLDAGLDYSEAGRRLGIAPGLAYLIATGQPADAGDVPSPEERAWRGLMPTSQQLSNPEPENPTGADQVRLWIRARVQDDPQMRGV